MFKFIKRCQKRCERKAILKDIKKAKWYYETGQEDLMFCFLRVDPEKYCNYDKLHQRIPEIDLEIIDAILYDSRISLWDYIADKESRIKDFDKLIKIYSK